MEKKKILKGGVVGTMMSNYGLQNYFKDQNIKFLRADVETDTLKKKCKNLNLI